MTDLDAQIVAEAAAIAARFASALLSDTDAEEDDADSLTSSPLGGGTPTQSQLEIPATVGDGMPIDLYVNPNSVTIDKGQNTSSSRASRRSGVSNSSSGGVPLSGVGTTQYKGSQPAKLTIVGAVLGSDEGNKDISEQIESLFECLVPPSGDDSTAEPPSVTFKWGSWRPLDASYISNLAVKVTDWLEDGTPVRADVTTLVLTEMSVSEEGQNPTSGAFGSRKTHTVIAGDSLASIAYSAYGRADYWRAIADVNGIDDPLRLRTGTELLIPPRDYARNNK